MFAVAPNALPHSNTSDANINAKTETGWTALMMTRGVFLANTGRLFPAAQAILEKALAQRNTQFLHTLLAADAVVIAGQAASHCVKSTIDDLLDEIVAADKKLAEKVWLLTDCMSAVTVPDGKGGFAIDFTDQADAALARFANAGLHLVRSSSARSIDM